MADNITLNVGSSGSSLATDDVTDAGGAHYQRVKLTDGTANSETHIQAGNGTSANALRVTVSSDSTGVLSVDDNGGSLTVDGTVTANAGSGTFTVDGSGVTQPVSNAGLTELAAAINASSQMDVNIAASAATVTVDGSGVTQPVSGTVTANLSATDNAVLDNIDTNTDYGQVVGGGVEATALRVTIASDSTGVVSVDDGGGALTVDGTVTANLSATDNAVLDDIAAKLAPNTTNGHTPYLNQDTSAVDTVKSGAGTVYWISCMSIDATPVYLNLYDSTTAVLGTTTPTNQFIVPTQGDANGAGFTINFGPLGIQYGTGIQVAAATTFNGSTDPGTNVVITNIGYE